MRAASASHTGIPEVAPKRSVAPGDLARRTLLSGAGGSTLGLALAAFCGAAALPQIRPNRRKHLLQSISEAAATAPGWSQREPSFYPEWVEKEAA